MGLAAEPILVVELSRLESTRDARPTWNVGLLEMPMSGYNVSVPHKLGREAALVRVRQFLDQVRHNYGDDVSDVSGLWDGNRLEFSFAARGLMVRGTLLVEEALVQVAGPLPWRPCSSAGGSSSKSGRNWRSF